MASAAGRDAHEHVGCVGRGVLRAGAAGEKREREEREEREREEFEWANERKQKQQDWLQKLEEIHEEQNLTLNTQTLPLRNYLMKHVMPTLTKALIGMKNQTSRMIYSCIFFL